VPSLSELRVRTRVPSEQIEQVKGKNLTPADWDILLTGPACVRRPDGKPLAVYLPGAMAKFTQDAGTYAILDAMGRSGKTGNRGMAGATPSLPRGTQKRTYAVPVHSNIIGAIDPGGIYKVCRTTVWTGAHLEQWQQLFPLFTEVAARLEHYVPDRYAAQVAAAANTAPEWVVPGTPFSTITVNHTYPTGVHVDKGDLPEGFSTIFCARTGTYTGGQLCFPEYRVAVDLQDGDLLLMDAHSYHGNAKITCGCGTALTAPCKHCGAGRVSVVTYFRTKLQQCGTAEEELEKARSRRELRV
jgi:Oxygenase domain of the 2OGFeDO superfamily